MLHQNPAPRSSLGYSSPPSPPFPIPAPNSTHRCLHSLASAFLNVTLQCPSLLHPSQHPWLPVLSSISIPKASPSGTLGYPSLLHPVQSQTAPMGDHSLQHLHPQDKPKRHLGVLLLADPSPHQTAPIGAHPPVTFIPRWDCRVPILTAPNLAPMGAHPLQHLHFHIKTWSTHPCRPKPAPRSIHRCSSLGHLHLQSQTPLRRFSSLLTQHRSGHWGATRLTPLLPPHYFPLPRSPAWCHGSWWLPAAGPSAARRHCTGPALVPRMVPGGQEGPQRPTGRDPASFPTSSPNPNPVLTYCPLSAITTTPQLPPPFGLFPPMATTTPKFTALHITPPSRITLSHPGYPCQDFKSPSYSPTPLWDYPPNPA